MKSKTCKLWLILICAVCAAYLGCARREAEPTPPEPVRPASVARPALAFNPVPGAAENVKEAVLTSQSLPSLQSQLEIRTIIVQGGQQISLPVPNEGIYEVRAGSLAVIENGQTQKRDRGDIWQVAKGSRVTVQAYDELAVIRAIYLVTGRK
jgi:hypothetical protein